jgi:hypothetical protein
VPTTVHLKKSVITAQNAFAAAAVLAGVFLYIRFRAIPFTVAFATVAVFNAGIARWTRRNPVLHADDEGLTLKRAVLSKPVRLPWSRLEGLSLVEDKWLDIKMKDEPAIRLLATNLEGAQLKQLLDVSRQRA